MIRTAALLTVSLILVPSFRAADKPDGVPIALERKLHGGWKGGACQGDWTFAADGTFVLTHYSPGNNRLTGRWSVRWDALPPTLVLTIKTSDAPDRIKIGQAWEVKLTQLDDAVLAYEWPRSPGHPVRFDRAKK